MPLSFSERMDRMERVSRESGRINWTQIIVQAIVTLGGILVVVLPVWLSLHNGQARVEIKTDGLAKSLANSRYAEGQAEGKEQGRAAEAADNAARDEQHLEWVQSPGPTGVPGKPGKSGAQGKSGRQGDKGSWLPW